MTESTEQQSFQNPSYDKSLPVSSRLYDFLGAYHLVLHGVVAHEPFERTGEDGSGMCDDDDKKRLVEFVELLLNQSKSVWQSQLRKEIEGLLKQENQFGFQGILMGINSAASNQTYNSAIKDVLNLLQETK